jgi:hypothetical protein
MGLIAVTWRFADRAPPAIDEAERSLREATGLEIKRSEDHELAIPLLGELVLGWEYGPDTLTLLGGIPRHPYLWENLDRVMAALGGIRDERPTGGIANPADATLRTRWDALSPRDRWLLRLPPLLASRPLDRFLSGRRAAK